MTTKPERVVFPHGECDQKTRYLIDGFQRLGIRVESKPDGVKIGVTPFVVHYPGGRTVLGGHDIGCLDREHLSKGRGEGRAWWEGRDDVLFFKVHASPALLDPSRRIFPMPQALGRLSFLRAIEGFRLRRSARPRDLDLFGIFTDGGLRTAAVRRVKRGPWRSMVGIGRARKGSPSGIAADVFRALLPEASYFATMAGARLALSLPSHGGAVGPWCSYRHVEAWALGVPVLTVRPHDYAVFGAPGPGCWVEMADDLSDLEAVIDGYLGDRERAAEAERNAAAYFDAHFTPERHAAHILDTIEREVRP